MTSNPAFTERNIQKANAYLLYSRQEQKSLVTYHTLQSLYVCVWLVNTLTSTAPIGSPIICMWSPADICEQWERNLSFGSAEVCGAGTRDEPQRMSTWEARACKQALYLGESWEVTQEPHMKGDECVRDGNMRLPRSRKIVLSRFTSLTYIIGEFARSLLKILRGPPNP